MKLTVLIPTLQRTAHLQRCLDALTRQQRRPDQVVIVTRRDDEETAAFLADYLRDQLAVDVVHTGLGGQVGALNTGLRHVGGDVVAILDDDTSPWPDWLARIERHFQDEPRLGGLGGRDILYTEEAAEVRETSRVGRLLWYGRWIGQAHRGYGPPRPVELLKGCNMSYRRAAIHEIWFDDRLRGNGAQWFNDATFSMRVRSAGWEVLYDPAVLVDHFHGARQDGDDRAVTTPAEVYDLAFNETLAIAEFLPPVRRGLFIAFAFLVGNRRVPGLLQWARLALTGCSNGPDYQLSAWKGRLDALRRYWLDRQPPAAEFDHQCFSLL